MNNLIHNFNINTILNYIGNNYFIIFIIIIAVSIVYIFCFDKKFYKLISNVFVIDGIALILFIALNTYILYVNKYEYLFRPSIYFLIAVLAMSIVILSISEFLKRGSIVRFKNLSWNLNDFCRGWLITGKTGSGKTASAIMRILHQLFTNTPNWGGLVVDEKGSFFKILADVAENYKIKDKLITLQVRPDTAPTNWTPKFKFNLLSYPGIPWSTYAKIIVDTATSQGQSGDKGFFKSQALIHIAKAMEFLEVLDIPVTISNISELLQSSDSFIRMTENMSDNQSRHPAALHFADNFLNQPPDQQGAVISTIFNYLHFYTDPNIKEIFCAEESNVNLADIDKGKIFSISLPQKYQIERKYINTFMKFLYYIHALKRFDSPGRIKDKNILVLMADEAQGVVTNSSEGMEDYNVLDKIREAKATAIFATQSTTSFLPKLGHDKTKTLLLNLGNHIYYTLADKDGANIAADHIGKKEYDKKSYSHSQGKTTVNYQKIEEHYIKTHVLMKMKKFHCVIKHCEGKFIKTKLTPVDSNNQRPKYYKWYKRILG